MQSTLPAEERFRLSPHLIHGKSCLDLTFVQRGCHATRGKVYRLSSINLDQVPSFTLGERMTSTMCHSSPFGLSLAGPQHDPNDGKYSDSNASAATCVNGSKYIASSNDG